MISKADFQKGCVANYILYKSYITLNYSKLNYSNITTKYLQTYIQGVPKKTEPA